MSEKDKMMLATVAGLAAGMQSPPRETFDDPPREHDYKKGKRNKKIKRKAKQLSQRKNRS